MEHAAVKPWLLCATERQGGGDRWFHAAVASVPAADVNGRRDGEVFDPRPAAPRAGPAGHVAALD